jgi:hypothetical protein
LPSIEEGIVFKHAGMGRQRMISGRQVKRRYLGAGLKSCMQCQTQLVHGFLSRRAFGCECQRLTGAHAKTVAIGLLDQHGDFHEYFSASNEMI